MESSLLSLNQEKLALYIDLLKRGKPNLSNMYDASIYELMSVTRNNEVTLSTAMIFSPYPQAYFPQLCITAIREAVINALVHRDYSIHTEGMPIQIIMYEDRMEIKNSGGIYGRIKVDQLGKMQPDTRNPVLAFALETLHVTENRYSGIPTIRREMEKYNLKEPKFEDERGSFIVIFYKADNISKTKPGLEDTNDLLVFCRTPRTRKEICEYLGLSSITYAIQTYVMPLVESGKIKMTNPDKPKSTKQLFYSE